MPKLRRYLFNSKFLLILGVISIAGVFANHVEAKTIDFEELFVGFNGPRNPGTLYFDSKLAVDKSWVRRSLRDDDYNKLLSSLDFNHQVLLALAIGERESVSGTVRITYFRQLTNLRQPVLDVSAEVGIVGRSCQRKALKSYPFVLAKFERPDQFQPIGGIDIGSFEDQCTVEKLGRPEEKP